MPNGPDYKAKVRPHGPIEDNPGPIQSENAGLDISDADDAGFETAAQAIVDDPAVAPVGDGQTSQDDLAEQSIAAEPERNAKRLPERPLNERAETPEAGPESRRSIGRKG
jgi:hypothetical protein